jgi:hypothetical protein
VFLVLILLLYQVIFIGASIGVAIWLYRRTRLRAALWYAIGRVLTALIIPLVSAAVVGDLFRSRFFGGGDPLIQTWMVVLAAMFDPISTALLVWLLVSLAQHLPEGIGMVRAEAGMRHFLWEPPVKVPPPPAPNESSPYET